MLMVHGFILYICCCCFFFVVLYLGEEGVVKKKENASGEQNKDKRLMQDGPTKWLGVRLEETDALRMMGDGDTNSRRLRSPTRKRA